MSKINNSDYKTRLTVKLKV